MQYWERNIHFKETKFSWVLPSSNLGRSESTFTFAATVLFKGTTLSEGRVTTQPLEVVEHPKIEPF